MGSSVLSLQLFYNSNYSQVKVSIILKNGHKTRTHCSPKKIYVWQKAHDKTFNIISY